MTPKSPGYDYPPAPPVQNEPLWAGMLTTSSQKLMDSEYEKALDNYYGQMKSYVETQVVTRRNSADPANYVPAEFKVPIPRREIMTYDVNKSPAPYLMDPDPSIPKPVIPPYVAPPVSQVPGGAGIRPPAMTGEQSLLAAVSLLLQQVASLKADLVAIKSIMGIKS